MVDVDTLVRDHEPLARAVAARTVAPPVETFDEIYSDALLGLWDAAKRYDPARGKFTTFAVPRIKGAIADGRRQRDPLTRGQRAAGVESPLHLDAPLAHRSNGFTNLTLADLVTDTVDPIGDWIDETAEADAHDRLMAAVAALPDRQRYVIERQLAGATLATAGAELGVTESRACQLRHAALERLRHTLVAA